jgi:hypothetical protein
VNKRAARIVNRTARGINLASNVFRMHRFLPKRITSKLVLRLSSKNLFNLVGRKQLGLAVAQRIKNPVDKAIVLCISQAKGPADINLFRKIYFGKCTAQDLVEFDYKLSKFMRISKDPEIKRIGLMKRGEVFDTQPLIRYANMVFKKLNEIDKWGRMYGKNIDNKMLDFSNASKQFIIRFSMRGVLDELGVVDPVKRKTIQKLALKIIERQSQLMETKRKNGDLYWGELILKLEEEIGNKNQTKILLSKFNSRVTGAMNFFKMVLERIRLIRFAEGLIMEESARQQNGQAQPTIKEIQEQRARREMDLTDSK